MILLGKNDFTIVNNTISISKRGVIHLNTSIVKRMGIEKGSKAYLAKDAHMIYIAFSKGNLNGREGFNVSVQERKGKNLCACLRIAKVLKHYKAYYPDRKNVVIEKVEGMNAIKFKASKY